jgi:hypothetical protein
MVPITLSVESSAGSLPAPYVFFWSIARRGHAGCSRSCDAVGPGAVDVRETSRSSDTSDVASPQPSSRASHTRPDRRSSFEMRRASLVRSRRNIVLSRVLFFGQPARPCEHVLHMFSPVSCGHLGQHSAQREALLRTLVQDAVAFLRLSRLGASR